MEHEPNQLSADSRSLSPKSKSLAQLVFLRQPEWRRHATTERHASSEMEFLRLDFASPTGDPYRDLQIVVLEGDDPSVFFGPWHTHADVLAAEYDDWRDGVISVAEAVLGGELVITRDLAEPDDKTLWTILDLREPDALAKELTSPYSSGRMRIMTWSGAGDRELGWKTLSRHP